MKVAVVIDSWFPAIGGGQINVWEISKRLAKKGIKIEILTRNNGKDYLERISNLTIKKFGQKSRPEDNVARLYYLIRLFIYLLSHDFDLIHIHPFLPALVVKLISLIKSTPTAFTVHGTRMFEKEKNFSAGLLLEKFILTKIRYSQVISVTKAFLKFKNVNKNINVIPNGIDWKIFNRINVAKTPYIKILWVGRFDPVKRVEDLIIASKIVAKAIKNVQFVLVGYGYNENSLKEFSKEIGAKNIIFKHLKNRDDLIKEYKSSHIFVLTSSSEGQPITILEAQAAKLPVVATNVGGIPEIVTNNKNGLLVSPKKPQSIAIGIIKALKDKKKFSQGGYKSVQNYHNWDNIAKITLEIYNRTLR